MVLDVVDELLDELGELLDEPELDLPPPQEEISNAVRHTDTTKTISLIIEPFLSSSVRLNQPLVGCITTNYIPLFLAWIWLCVGV